MAEKKLTFYDKASAAAEYIKKNLEPGWLPEVGIVLGSGLGPFASEVKNPVILPYANIPHFPMSTVAGHAGRLVIGTLGTKKVIVQQGRWHFYEGYEIQDVVLGIRVMHHLGVKKLVITNAAGAVNTEFKPGQLMLIKDHINMLGVNPLVGPNDERYGVRFPDMSTAYTPALRVLAKQVVKDLGLTDMVQEGVYVAMRGPSYETPAEIRMVRIMQGDAVGMSTVPEVVVARHCGMQILGISCLTNMGAGILDQPLSHTEVEETAKIASANFTKLVTNIVIRM